MKKLAVIAIALGIAAYIRGSVGFWIFVVAVGAPAIWQLIKLVTSARVSGGGQLS